MKAICEGRSTRNDVVQQNLEQYRAVFVRTMQQIGVLKAVGCPNECGAEAATNIALRIGNQEVRCRSEQRLRHFTNRCTTCSAS